MSDLTVFSPDFKEFVELLNKNEVKYLITGGYAVSLYGHPRNTGDIDFWVEPTDTNAKNLVQVFNEFGLSSFEVSEKDFLKKDSVIQIGYPPYRIDIITGIDGVSFDEAYPNKKVVNLDGVDLIFIGIKELKRNKKATGRHKDLDDLENLE